MKPVVSSEEARRHDARLVAAGVPSLVLMENAGAGAARALVVHALAGRAAGRSVTVLAGGGNNGGDGWVVARHLVAEGARVRAFDACGARRSPDNAANLAAFVAVGGVVERLAVGELPDDDALDADVVVDALFGTGLARDLDAWGRALVTHASRTRGTRVALDVPSGTCADTGRARGASFEADLTLTFGHLKRGVATGQGARRAGRLEVVGLGAPSELAHVPTAWLVEDDDVAGRLGARARDAHKHALGRVLVVAGRPGAEGAAELASLGALRAGAGLVTVATWEGAVLPGLAREVMRVRVPEHADAGTHLARAAREGRAEVVVAGPGFGTDGLAEAALTALAHAHRGPLVLDADALTVLARQGTLADAVSTRAPAGPRALVLTPHAGELGRLLGRSSAAVEADRYAAVREAATRFGAVVVLKGLGSLVASSDAPLAIVGAGTPALATPGAGDVLAGATGALAARLPAFDAAWVAAHVHGRAGEVAASGTDRGLLATEVADALPAVVGAAARARGRRRQEAGVEP